jgi:hypothetical protein
LKLISEAFTDSSNEILKMMPVVDVKKFKDMCTTGRYEEGWLTMPDFIMDMCSEAGKKALDLVNSLADFLKKTMRELLTVVKPKVLELIKKIKGLLPSATSEAAGLGVMEAAKAITKAKNNAKLAGQMQNYVKTILDQVKAAAKAIAAGFKKGFEWMMQYAADAKHFILEVGGRTSRKSLQETQVLGVRGSKIYRSDEITAQENLDAPEQMQMPRGPAPDEAGQSEEAKVQPKEASEEGSEVQPEEGAEEDSDGSGKRV